MRTGDVQLTSWDSRAMNSKRVHGQPTPTPALDEPLYPARVYVNVSDGRSLVGMEEQQGYEADFRSSLQDDWQGSPPDDKVDFFAEWIPNIHRYLHIVESCRFILFAELALVGYVVCLWTGPDNVLTGNANAIYTTPSWMICIPIQVIWYKNWTLFKAGICGSTDHNSQASYRAEKVYARLKATIFKLSRSFDIGCSSPRRPRQDGRVMRPLVADAKAAITFAAKIGYFIHGLVCVWFILQTVGDTWTIQGNICYFLLMQCVVLSILVPFLLWYIELQLLQINVRSFRDDIVATIHAHYESAENADTLVFPWRRQGGADQPRFRAWYMMECFGTPFTSLDDFSLGYLDVQDNLLIASVEWSATIFGVLILASVWFLYNVVLILMRFHPTYDGNYIGNMCSALLIITAPLVISLKANVGCLTINSAFIQAPLGSWQAIITRQQTSVDVKLLQDFVQRNPAFYCIYGFAITPSFVVGFLSGAGASAVVAIVSKVTQGFGDHFG